jgi:hypothetical protein
MSMSQTRGRLHRAFTYSTKPVEESSGEWRIPFFQLSLSLLI